MGVATLRTQMNRLKELVARRVAAERTPLLERLRQDPALILSDGLNSPADPWQTSLLRSPCSRLQILASRQAGKSLTAAALALQAALLEPCSLVLLLSPVLRQSGELLRDKVMRLYQGLGRPVPGEATALELRLANGSRIVSLPGNEGGIRCYSGVRLLICDEAARIPDDLYRAVRPMLAVSRGRLVCLSTPFGKRGWFYEEWVGAAPWRKVKVTADMVERITPDFLSEERTALGERWYMQEYFCSFEEVVDAVFRQEDIDAACADVEPLFGYGGRA